jgi:hypothetical protein
VSLNRYAKKRDDNERGIIQALEHVGALVLQLDRPCDLLVGYGRQWVLMECKMPGAKLTPSQDDFFAAWSKHGGCGLATVVRNASEALSAIGCETRGVEVGPRVMTSPWLDGTGGGA